MVRLGAHVSASGGLAKAVERARAIGAECVQIFASAPQTWRPPKQSDEDASAFRTACIEAGVRPIVIHAIYLVNPASPSVEIREKSVRSLVETLAAADRLGAEGVITHLGSATGSTRGEAIDRLCRSVEEILAAHSGSARLLLEICAGQGLTLGVRFEEVGEVIRRLGSPPTLGTAFDSAHAHAAGYDLTNEDAVNRTMDEFDRCIGLDRLVAVHLNDSKSALGSNVDRHENLGSGQIGRKGLAAILRSPAFAGRPIYLEVPGFENQGPDLANMALLYELAGRKFPLAAPTSSPGT